MRNKTLRGIEMLAIIKISRKGNIVISCSIRGQLVIDRKGRRKKKVNFVIVSFLTSCSRYNYFRNGTR